MVVIIVAIVSMRKTCSRELDAHLDPRTKEMEHERKMKELEVEKAKVELERARLNKNPQAAVEGDGWRRRRWHFLMTRVRS